MILALENIRSLYNVGAIARTCEFFGVQELFLIGYSGIDPSDPRIIHRKLQKTSLGTINKLKLSHYENISEMAESNPSLKYIGLENRIPHQTQNLYKWKPQKNDFVLIAGNETDGLSKKAINLCETFLEIPRIGEHGSLNVATACGIAISHITALY